MHQEWHDQFELLHEFSERQFRAHLNAAHWKVLQDLEAQPETQSLERHFQHTSMAPANATRDLSDRQLNTLLARRNQNRRR